MSHRALPAMARWACPAGADCSLPAREQADVHDLRSAVFAGVGVIDGVLAFSQDLLGWTRSCRHPQSPVWLSGTQRFASHSRTLIGSRRSRYRLTSCSSLRVQSTETKVSLLELLLPSEYRRLALRPLLAPHRRVLAYCRTLLKLKSCSRRRCMSLRYPRSPLTRRCKQ